MSLLTDTPTIGTIDNRIIAVMRLVLATSALLIISIDHMETDRFVAVTYAPFILYVVYSALLYIPALRRTPLLSRIYTWAHWIDVAWYVVFVMLGGGTSSVFFFFFFFAILVASFRWGFVPGLRVTVVSASLFTIIGLVTVLRGAEVELSRLLSRPVYLLMLGYMMAHWGGFEITLKRRLALLREVTALSNPRFGVDRTIGSLMEQLRTFYNADACLLVMFDPAHGEHRLRRAVPSDPERAAHAEQIPADLANLLLALPDELAVVYAHNPRIWERWRPSRSYQAYNIGTGEHTAEGREVGEALAATLDTDSFVTVPFRYHGDLIGRLYLTARRHAFDQSDLDFLLQVIEHVTPVIDNIRLVDRLASDAAEEERQKIARDLHDSIIQPYIGLQFGLAAIRQKLLAGNSNITGDVERLIDLTGEGIADLRSYMGGLKGAGERESGLLPAVRRFTAKFAEATGITVRVEAAADLHINDRLAAEVFQMVAEGLSNVRRHTHATWATISLVRCNGHLILRIGNEECNGSALAPFIPRSITGRATALGGRVHVNQHENDGTIVVVEIPL